MKKNEKLLAAAIRAEYEEKPSGELEALRELDARVKRPAYAFAYSYGTVGALVLGTGMSLAMKVIGNAMVPGIAIGLVGIAVVSTTYSIYQKMLASRRQRYKGEIEALCRRIEDSDRDE
ncbi:MAG: dihydropteridine reductase [Clostridia bacterium]|nr:dihydropteridine reductase [Clostridia bacterium]